MTQVASLHMMEVQSNGEVRKKQSLQYAAQISHSNNNNVNTHTTIQKCEAGTEVHRPEGF